MKVEVPESVRQLWAEYGRQGGKLGGKKRWADKSSEERKTEMAKVRAAIKQKPVK